MVIKPREFYHPTHRTAPTGPVASGSSPCAHRPPAIRPPPPESGRRTRATGTPHEVCPATWLPSRGTPPILPARSALDSRVRKVLRRRHRYPPRLGPVEYHLVGGGSAWSG